MLDFSKITNWQYLTTRNPKADFEFLPHLLVFFSALAALAVIIAIAYRPTNHLLRRLKRQITRMLWTCSALGFMLLFFRWQSLGIFSQRIWLIILAIIFLCWIIYLIFYRYCILTKQLNFYRKQLEFKRYLPKKRDK